jgi:uncharacterized GH25 family protein
MTSRTSPLKFTIGIAVIAPLLAQHAVAHSPYLLPNRFDVSQRDHVSVQASFTEDFFVPDVVMKASAYHVVTPDGTKVPLEPSYTQDLAVLDVATRLPGTYRISTGIREGRLSKAAIDGDEWQFLDEREALPTGVRIYDIRSITLAEVYVTRGAPSDAVLAPHNDGLEFQLLAHPNSLFAGDDARVRVLFDGQPLTGQTIVLQRSSMGYGDASPPVEITSDKEGVVTLPFPEAGLYHAMTRHRFALPGAHAKAESHTYAITLEVTE